MRTKLIDKILDFYPSLWYSVEVGMQVGFRWKKQDDGSKHCL